ncbi:MAG: LapA family protein [Alphaproteobacteria bacterium]|nr:LapA family protein [Alphaproteobacteria bacterium]
MKTWLYLFLFALALALLGGGYLFWVQNSSQVVTVSFELWGVGRYGRTMTAPELIGWAVGAGFLLGLVPMGWRSMRLGRRVRQLEQQVAMSGSGDSASSWR